MNKRLKGLPLFLTVSLILVFLIANTAYASPGTSTVDAYPTAYVESWSPSEVSNPTYAYDGDFDTAAVFDYDPNDPDPGAGSFEVKTFTQPSSNIIVSVDLKMNYAADGGNAGEQYRIVYRVGSSAATVLVDWTNAAHAQANVTWASQGEPNDGTWSWTDIHDLRIIVETGVGGQAADTFSEYETWVTVTIYSYTVGTMFVDPASLTDPSSPFTVDINVSNVEDLYGWEFKLYYNNTILSNGSVTEGPFLSSAGSTQFFVLNNTDTYNATHGRFWVACTLTGHTAGKTGSGTLATITFTVDGTAGTTPLDLTDTKLVGYVYSASTLIQMNHNTTDGQVTITAVVPEFPLGAALEIALAGVIVYIWWRGRRKRSQVSCKASLPP